MIYNIILYSCLNAFYTASIFSDYKLPFSILSFIFLIIVGFLEIKSGSYKWLTHFSDIYNFLDILLIFLLLISLILNLCYDEASSHLHELNFVCLLLLNL